MITRHQLPKGVSDVQVVWNLMKNGVNPTVLSPYFFLCTITSLCRRLNSGDNQGDFDIKEQYHNYLLHISERAYHGVIIPSRVCKNKNFELATPLICFTRVPFGWGHAAYLAFRMFARALELNKGNPNNMQSPFHWNEVALSLPREINHNPVLARVRLVRTDNKRAAEIIYLFDEKRVHGPAGGLFRARLQRASTGIQYLGNQIALRKYRVPSSRPSAWNGGCIYTYQILPIKLLRQIKWDRRKNNICSLQEYTD